MQDFKAPKRKKLDIAPIVEKENPILDNYYKSMQLLINGLVGL